MRRTVALLVVLSLFAFGSSAASAAVSKTTISIRALVAQADWESVDPDTGAGEFGVLQFATEKTGTTVAFVLSRGELVQCSGQDTPNDPSDDVFGFLGTSMQGGGRGQLKVGRSYMTAVGSATIQAQVSEVNECTGGSSVDSSKRVAVSLDLTSIGPVMIQKGRTTLTIPSQLRSKTFVQSRSRQAAGTVVVDGRRIDVGGDVGDVSLRAMAMGG